MLVVCMWSICADHKRRANHKSFLESIELRSGREHSAWRHRGTQRCCRGRRSKLFGRGPFSQQNICTVQRRTVCSDSTALNTEPWLIRTVTCYNLHQIPFTHPSFPLILLLAQPLVVFCGEVLGALGDCDVMGEPVTHVLQKFSHHSILSILQSQHPDQQHHKDQLTQHETMAQTLCWLWHTTQKYKCGSGLQIKKVVWNWSYIGTRVGQ